MRVLGHKSISLEFVFASLFLVGTFTLIKHKMSREVTTVQGGRKASSLSPERFFTPSKLAQVPGQTETNTNGRQTNVDSKMSEVVMRISNSLGIAKA
jgi:hypothetical protein